jgi:hypothetical protein
LTSGKSLYISLWAVSADWPAQLFSNNEDKAGVEPKGSYPPAK